MAKAKTPAKKKVKKSASKKKGTGDIEKILNEIKRRNQTIMKESRKIEELLGKAKPAPTALADDDCVPPVPISNLFP
jgi:hypothetical protein